MAPAPETRLRALPATVRVWRGDFDGMFERCIIRACGCRTASTLEDFYAQQVKKAGMARALREQQSRRALRDAGASEDAKRFDERLVLFRKYGERHA